VLATSYFIMRLAPLIMLCGTKKTSYHSQSSIPKEAKEGKEEGKSK